MRKTLILFLILTTVGGCSTKIRRISEKNPPTTQLVLFQYSYVNNAWGYQNRGWFVNNHGLAKAYQVRDKNLWQEPSRTGPDSGYISERDLYADYALADKVVFEFSHFILNKMIIRIDSTFAGPFTEPMRGAYDRGLMKYSCYYWDKSKGMYKEVLLSLDGDTKQTNLNPDADTLVGWLKGLEPIYQDSLKAWDEVQGGGK
jgi:hypothetical protein